MGAGGSVLAQSQLHEDFVSKKDSISRFLLTDVLCEQLLYCLGNNGVIEGLHVQSSLAGFSACRRCRQRLNDGLLGLPSPSYNAFILPWFLMWSVIPPTLDADVQGSLEPTS